MENHTSLWAIANRPIVVLIVGLMAWPFVSSWATARAARQNVGGVAGGIRDVIEELSDAERHGEFQRLASGIISQITDGFRAALSRPFGGSGDTVDPVEQFRQLVRSVTISDIGKAASPFKGRESWIANVSNATQEPLRQIKIAASFYNSDGKLVDVINKWLHEIKVLEPGQEVGFRLDRTLGDSQADPKTYEPLVADRVDLQVVDFAVHKPKDSE